MFRSIALATIFVVILAVSVGCHVTNYALIVDNNQTGDPGGPGEIIVTDGKAKLVFASQWATVQADGIDENLTFIRQDASGSQTLYSHNNFSIAGEATFSDDLYCSPETKGCAAAKSYDPDPTDPGDDPFDKRVFDQCPGARSLCLTISTGRYYGECGRTSALAIRDRLNLWNLGKLSQRGGMEVLLYDVNRQNLTLTLDNRSGVVTDLPVTGSAEIWTSLSARRFGRMDLSNPLIGHMGRAYADWLAHFGSSATEVSACYNEVCRSWLIGGNEESEGEDGISTPARVLDQVNRRW
ncbi:hypothetical protein ABI59_12135 [Acidobacteria bacterium Mor1]|nr:hypothetical protein ABI59_12135 [Acidobacteria bacterium Mor1]